MSYICLIINKNGGVCAGDSRITVHTAIPGLTWHMDLGCKVFASKSRRTIWACDGITTRGPISFPLVAARIMRREDLSLDERLSLAEKKIARYTKPWFRLSKNHLIFNMLCASRDADGLPCACVLSVMDGHILPREEYHIQQNSFILENGMNAARLSDRRNYLPKADAPAEKLVKLARSRVKESIQKDKELKKADPKYRQTIGGKVKSVRL